MITFGLTGGIACGKSTVTKTFRNHNIPIVDADIVARQVVEVGSFGWSAIKYSFGTNYLNEDETVNRTKLGALVFNNKVSMFTLNAIMAPLIEIEAAKQIKAFYEDGHAMVGYDAALICELGNADKYRPLIVVACKTETQLARLMSRNSLTNDEAMSRISAQMPVAQKIAMADYVVDTEGAIEDSIKQTEKVISYLRQLVT
jgi:dephospho-CoA kinase